MWQKYYLSQPPDCKPHNELRGEQAKAIFFEDGRKPRFRPTSIVSSCASYSPRSPKSLVALLGLRRNLADRHVSMMRWAQRARCHRRSHVPVLSEVAGASSSSQHAPFRYRVGCAACRSELPRERFSPLTQSGHMPDQNLALSEP